MARDGQGQRVRQDGNAQGEDRERVENVAKVSRSVDLAGRRARESGRGVRLWRQIGPSLTFTWQIFLLQSVGARRSPRPAAAAMMKLPHRGMCMEGDLELDA